MKGLAAFAARRLGLTLYAGQIEVLRAWEASGKRKAVLALGRRSGKGLMAAVAAVANAVVIDYSGYLRPGETRFILVVATREQQAREFIRTVRELLTGATDPNLAALVDEPRCTADEVAFRTGVVVRALPCSSRAVRGLAASLVIFDEAAHFVSETEGFQAFRSVWRSLTPSVAQFGDRGYVLVTSTPKWPSGPFYDLYRSGETGQDRDLFVVRRPTWEVNPSITRESLTGEFAADPEGAAVEYGAQWLAGSGALLDASAVYECVVAGRKHLPPRSGVSYIAAIDPAFARGGDAFACAVGHLDGHGTAVLDMLQAWRGKDAPLSSDATLDDVAALLQRYGVRQVVSDQFSIIPISDGLRRRGVEVEQQALGAELKADIYTTLKRAINMREVELLDDPVLLAELNQIEVRPSPSGKPRIAAPSGRHDDLAMVVATVVHRLKRPAEVVGFLVFDDADPPDEPDPAEEISCTCGRLIRVTSQCPRCGKWGWEVEAEREVAEEAAS